MILYLDTSAILKKYFKEPGSNEVIAKWKEAGGIFTSSVAYAEVMAAFHRKNREVDIGRTRFRNILNSFQEDWSGFFHVEITDDLNRLIGRLVKVHPLRGFDAIHLASALVISEKVGKDLWFVCFDDRLLKAAKKEGLNTFPFFRSP
jgi:predicted nucleic acid-binding protein